MASAGTASIDVGGDFSGFNSGVENAGKNLLSKAGGWSTAIKAVIAPAFAIGAIIGLEQIGASFDDAFDKIRINTGQTGQALGGLQDSFKNVFSEVPSSMDTVADAISGVNQRLGLTGTPLEALSTQFINLSRITGTDLKTNVDNITRVFGDWGIATGDQGAAMDKLFRATQVSGIGIGDLSSSIVQFGAPLRNLGFTFEQSGALLALFNKTGVNTDTVIAGLKAGVGKLAKAGEDVPATFRRVVEEITKLGPGSEATGKAIELFGQRAGPDLADAIAGGKFSVDEMLKAIEGGTDTINQAASDTDDWREKLDILKNKALVALEPIASSVFDGFTKVATWLIDIGLPKLGDAFGTVRDALAPIVAAVVNWSTSSAWPALQTAAGIVAGAFQTAFGWVVDTGIPAVVGAFDAVKKWFDDNWPAIQAVFQDAWDKVQVGFQWLLDNKPALVAALTAVAAVMFGPLTAAAVGFVAAYTQFDGFREVVDNIVAWVKGTLLPNLRAALLWITENTGKLVAYISERWEAIKAAVTNITKVLVLAVAVALAPLIFIWTHAHDQIMAVVNVVWRNIQLVVGTAMRIIKDIIDIVLGLLSGDWGLAWDAIKDIPMAAFEFMIGTVKLGLEAIKLIIEGVLAILAALWQLAWDGLQTVLSAAWEGMKTAVLNALGIVVQWFTELPGRLVAAVGDLLALLVQKGKDLVQGLWNGAVEIWNLVSGWVAGIPGAVVAALPDLTQTLLQKGKDLLNGFWDGLLAIWRDVSNWFAGLPGAIASAVGDLAGTLFNAGSQLIGGFIAGVRSRADEAAKAVIAAIPGVTQIADAFNPDTGASWATGAIVPGSPGTPVKATVHGQELILNSRQQTNLLWEIANGRESMSSTSGTAAGHTFVTNVSGVAADPQELARLNAVEMTWMMRTQAAA